MSDCKVFGWVAASFLSLGIAGQAQAQSKQLPMGQGPSAPMSMGQGSAPGKSMPMGQAGAPGKSMPMGGAPQMPSKTMPAGQR